MDLELKGKRVLVTGGSRGIGFATALGFAREGAWVAICARGEAELRAAAERIRADTGAPVLTRVADVSDAAQVQALVDGVAQDFGGLDVLVNNAGRATPGGLEAVSDADWISDWDVSLGSMARACRAALPHLRNAGGGAIVNVTALVGREPNPATIVGSSHRAACMAFTKCLAGEAGARQIRVNAVNIGVVWSSLREQGWQAKAPHLSKEEFLAPFVRDVPLGRAGTTDEVADAILFLCSARSSYITGSCIDLGGGIGRSAF